MRNVYDIYDGEEKIREGLSAHEVHEFAGLKDRTNLSKYYRKCGFLLLGKYRLVVAGGSGAVERSYSPEQLFIKKFGESNYHTWKLMNERYGSKAEGSDGDVPV